MSDVKHLPNCDTLNPELWDALCNCAELRAEGFKAAYMEWQDKTEWVQKTAKPSELGKHRADVMRERIAKAETERDQLRAELIKANDRYQRDVYGLNNEGDPIGGEPPGGYANDNARLRAEVAMLRSYEAEWERSLNQLRAELEAIRGQQPDAVSVPGVHEFAVEILRGALEGGNFDGGDIQEIGVRHGLLFPEQRTERCGEYCECAEYGFPVECFRIARALLSTKNAEEGE